MALETKVILQMILNKVASAKSIEEIYFFVQQAASVEGINAPSYQEMKKIYEDLEDKSK